MNVRACNSRKQAALRDDVAYAATLTKSALGRAK